MKNDVPKRSMPVALVLTAILALVVPLGAGAQEIPWAGPTPLPDYIGAPAKPHPTANSGVPQNPFLAPNPFNSIHFDPWNSDVTNIATPLGRGLAVLSSTLAEARQTDNLAPPWIFDCPTVNFDSHGRPITICFSPTEATVVLADPDTLEVLSYYYLTVPPGTPWRGFGRQQLFSSMGSGYSYVGARDQLTIASGGNQIITLVEGGSEESPVLELPAGNTFDLSAVIATGDNITGVMVDWQGRIWFTTGKGTVNVLNPATYQQAGAQSVKGVKLGENEAIQNTFAVTKDGVYVVTSAKTYRVWAGSDDDPYVVWSEPYNTIGSVRNGQYELGSGTSPTILGDGRYVAITDNDTQLHVVVFRTDERIHPNETRKVCEVPVFTFPGGGAGADSNSLIGFRLSMIASNTYNYWFDWQTGQLLSPSAPGMERIDIDPNGKGCRTVWLNSDVATTVSPRLSTRTGLIYTLARQIDENGLDVYYWTALDFRTGETVWQKLAGTGEEYDSFYPNIGFGPNGALYSGAYAGLLTIKDTQ